jgi:hypothetical protein
MAQHPSGSTARAALAGLAATLFLLAACSAGGGSAASAPAGSAGAAGGGAAGGPVAAGASTVPGTCTNLAGGAVGAAGGPYASMLAAALCAMPNIDPCSMLKPADVQALFSVPLASPTTDHLGNCTWRLSDPSKGDGLDVVVNVGQGSGPLNDDINLATANQLTGIGDSAAWELIGGYFPHLGSVKGNATCELSIAGGDGQLSVPTTGQDVFAKIGPSDLPAFIKKFGDLCNQIFAGLGA